MAVSLSWCLTGDTGRGRERLSGYRREDASGWRPGCLGRRASVTVLQQPAVDEADDGLAGGKVREQVGGAEQPVGPEGAPAGRAGRRTPSAVTVVRERDPARRPDRRLEDQLPVPRHRSPARSRPRHRPGAGPGRAEPATDARRPRRAGPALRGPRTDAESAYHRAPGRPRATTAQTWSGPWSTRVLRELLQEPHDPDGSRAVRGREPSAATGSRDGGAVGGLPSSLRSRRKRSDDQRDLGVASLSQAASAEGRPCVTVGWRR